MANHQLAQQQLPSPQKAKLRRRSAKPAAASQRLSASKAAKVNQPQPLRKPAPQTKANPVIQLIQKRPLLIWISAWATMLLVGSIAMLGLANPGSVKTVKSVETENATVAESPLPQRQNEPNNLPAWLFGFAGLVCATGSWVIIKQTKGYGRRRRLRKPLASRLVSRKQPVRQQRQTNGSLPKRVVPRPKVADRPSSKKLALADAAKKARSSPQKQPKNQKNGKLAESLDLRKRHPLSSLLRKI